MSKKRNKKYEACFTCIPQRQKTNRDFFLAPPPRLNTVKLTTLPSKTLSYKQSPLTHK